VTVTAMIVSEEILSRQQ